MTEDELRHHLAAGVSIIVGTTAVSGEPHASRGYGMVPLGGRRFQVFLAATDAAAAANARTTGRIAVTTGDQRTYQSVQLKGAVETVAEAAAHEAAAAAAHMELFCDRVTLEDNLRREMLLAALPASYVTCTFTAEALFDQTPGPRAGGALEVP